MKPRYFITANILIILSLRLWATVPQPATRKPSLPYFLEPMNFKTVEMKLFQADVSGMVTDQYGDLGWNPAYLSQLKKRSVYFDLNLYTSSSTQAIIPAYRTDIYMVYPSWYSSTTVNAMQQAPLYNLALLVPLTNNLKIGILNRTIFDYGPFRSTYYYYGRGIEEAVYAEWSAIPDDLEPQRLEVDDNQQIMYGTQTELSAAYALTNRLDLGMRIGMTTYHCDGDLYNSKWGFYPHTSFADLNDEDLIIGGRYYTLGMGFLYRPNARTSFGIYAEMIDGDGDEETASVDTSYSWSERDTDPDYYSFSDYNLESNQNYNQLGTRPTITLSYERKVSDNFVFRSFLKYTKSTNDIDFTTSSEDTTWGDRTYDTYDNSSYHFQRRISHDANRQHYSGEGNEKTSYWRWFASLVYQTDDDWSLFGGVQINRYYSEKAYNETSDYYSATDYEYFHYEAGTYEYLTTHTKLYEYTHNYEKYSAIIPIGIKARAFNQLYVIIVAEQHYNFYTNEKEKGRLLYPERISRKWKNDSMIVNDVEIDRYEEYQSKPAKDLTRTTYINAGLSYKHPSGVNLFIRSNGNIMETSGWDIGFEYHW